MSISSRFAVGVHILSLIEFNKDGVSASEYLAESVNTNPALIRKIIGMLKKAGLVEVHPVFRELSLQGIYLTLLC